jgi:ABC-type Na+ transport system ATPase subunit NatA
MYYIWFMVVYIFFKEIALYGEFTIRETMQFFGMVNGMTPKQVDDKIEFLLKFLQLPSASRAVKNLR